MGKTDHVGGCLNAQVFLPLDVIFHCLPDLELSSLPCLGSVLSLLESLRDEVLLFGEGVSITEPF